MTDFNTMIDRLRARIEAQQKLLSASDDALKLLSEKLFALQSNAIAVIEKAIMIVLAETAPHLTEEQRVQLAVITMNKAIAAHYKQLQAIEQLNKAFAATPDLEEGGHE